MKDNLVFTIFVCLLTLIIVWFASSALVDYWDDYVADYYRTTLYEVCRKYDGDWDFYPMSDPAEGTVFKCYFGGRE